MKLDYRQTIEVDDSWDVIVVGGGPAGCTAAIGAARAGRKTLLIEATGALGGMGTNGLVPGWAPYYKDKDTPIYGGLSWKIFEENRSGQRQLGESDLDWVTIDQESLKVTYDRLVLESGAHVLFNTFMTAVVAEEDKDEAPRRVEHILISNKRGLHAVKARVYVDTTGDGDLAAWAGSPFAKGNAQGELQPASLCFTLSNVDTFAYLHGDAPNHTNIHGRAYKIAKDSNYPLVKDGHLCNNLVGPGTVGFNAGHLWGADSTNPENVSAALVEGRKTARELTSALQEYYPRAFGNAHLVATAPVLGVRETRRLIGDYEITIEDYLERMKFPDEIGRNAYPVDIHTAEAEITDSINGTIHAMDRYEHYKPGESHGIPYRSLIPANLSNVLTAGRCISTDRAVNASVRVMPVAMVTGEAAGTAAGMAAENGGDVRTIDVDKLRAALKQAGAYLP